MRTLLHCTICKEIFQTRSLLDNHFRRLHQSVVKVRFRTRQVQEISRNPDNTFTCNCGNIFRHPGSLVQHAKQCDYSLQLDHYQLMDRESQSKDSTDEDVASAIENLGDCIGT